jgi:1,4-dihydroxy-2-naphthoate octaprenyltransferase
VSHINWCHALLIFFILHFLIYPASNGYNSFMDRDTESIGGLEKPPPPSNQLYYVTIMLDLLALALSCIIGIFFATIIVLYIAASKAYSYRKIRLKKYPVTGYLTVIIFQGALTFWLVYFGSNSLYVLHVPWQGIVVCTLLIGGFYPLTQIYQHKQDLDDGVATISYKLGYKGTFIFCATMYLLAWVFMARLFINNNEANKLIMVSILLLPILVYFIKWFWLVNKNSSNADFKHTMRMNWIASICTNTAFLILLFWNHFE